MCYDLETLEVLLYGRLCNVCVWLYNSTMWGHAVTDDAESRQEHENTCNQVVVGLNFSWVFSEHILLSCLMLISFDCFLMLYVYIITMLLTSNTCRCCCPSDWCSFLSIWLFFFLLSGMRRTTDHSYFKRAVLRQSPSSSPHFLQLFKTVPLQNRQPMTAAGALWGPAFKLIRGY